MTATTAATKANAPVAGNGTVVKAKKSASVAVWGQKQDLVYFLFLAARQGGFAFCIWLLARWLLRTTVSLFPNATEYQLAVGGTFMLHQVVFWAVNLFFIYVDMFKPPSIYKYRIQGHTEVTWEQIWRCTKRVTVNQFLVLLPMNYLAIPFWQARGLDTNPDTMPDLLTTFLQLVGMVLIHEFFFFYSHWLAHWNRIYKYVHKVHHNFTAPIAMSSEYAHVIEMAVSNVWPVMAGGVILGVHLQVMWTFMIIGLLTTANGHCGYRLPWSPFGDSTVHDYHHSAQRDNYGSLGLGDWLHGTNKHYHAFVQRMEAEAAAAKQQ